MSDYNKRLVEYLGLISVECLIEADEQQNCPDRCEPTTYSPLDKNKGGRRNVTHSHGWKYRLTMKRQGSVLVLDGFWNSVASRYNTLPINVECKPGTIAASPNVYDMLSCFVGESGTPYSTFDEWCSELELDSDSISAHKNYVQSCRTGILLNRFFSQSELEQLQELAS